MNGFATRPANERAEVFVETSARRGIGRAAITEKDFWVCWTLAQLFGDFGPASTTHDSPALLFKGGTSLSKAFGLIDRFSEDVDLTVDRQLLLHENENPSDTGISNHERRRRLDRVNQRCTEYVQNTIVPFLRARDLDWTGGTVVIDKGDPQTVLFNYPRSLRDADYGGSAYVSAIIRLEFGARGDLWPAVRAPVTPYAAEEYPDLFSNPTANVWALAAQRTFWEKATILHAIACSGRTGGGERQSRHYADLARMMRTPAGEEALSHVSLLNDVALHKATFFASAPARYDLAKPGTLRLVPRTSLQGELKRDYSRMTEMFLQSPPSFEQIIEDLSKLEKRINGMATGAL